jgi:lantibiotic modifying enzyme
MYKQITYLAQIIQQYNKLGANNSLIHGNSGLSIFYYILSRITNNPNYETIADELLDKIIKSLNNSLPADFENGLAGIGWAVEYLVQNNFAEGNTDEILKEIDNKIFKFLNEENLSSIELTTGLTGYLFYIISRLKNKGNPDSMAQRINRELLILTINKIDELIIDQFSSIAKELHFDLMWRFPVMLFALSKAFELNIYNH